MIDRASGERCPTCGSTNRKARGRTFPNGTRGALPNSGVIECRDPWHDSDSAERKGEQMEREENWLGKVMKGATKRHEAREELESRLSYDEPFVKPSARPAKQGTAEQLAKQVCCVLVDSSKSGKDTLKEIAEMLRPHLRASAVSAPEPDAGIPAPTSVRTEEAKRQLANCQCSTFNEGVLLQLRLLMEDFEAANTRIATLERQIYETK